MYRASGAHWALGRLGARALGRGGGVLGRIIAVDMLCNNFDRSPLIWNHEGNANNVLIRAVGGQVTHPHTHMHTRTCTHAHTPLGQAHADPRKPLTGAC